MNELIPTLAFEPHLLLPMSLTVAVEVPIFYLLGYRTIRFCAIFALVNCLSNILLNEFLEVCVFKNLWDCVVLCAEAMVVLLEYTLLCYVIPHAHGKLFKVLLCTNVVSYLIGIMVAT